MRWEAQDVLSIELELAGDGVLPSWEPGAHIDVVMPGGVERQYSLCGDLFAESWRIAVLREQAGRGGSEWIHDNLRVGHFLRVDGPRNHFALVEAPSYLFIAGGIGVTPLLPMVQEVARSGAEWRLLYGGRERASMAFTHELMQHGDRVEVAPQSEAGLLDLSQIDATRPGTVVYCCGPSALIDAVTERCEQVGRDVHVERFTPLISADEARHGDSFEVVLDRSGITLHIGDGQSILDGAEAAGIWPPSSCLEGTCGTCETPVLEGQVDHRDSILTESEQVEGKTMMICVSRSKSTRLVLDL